MIFAIIIIMAVLFYLSLKITKNIFSFPSFIILFFGLYSVVAYLFTFDTYKYSYKIFVFLIGMFIMLITGYGIASFFEKRYLIISYDVVKKKNVFLSKKLFLVGLVLCFLLASANVYFNISALGFGITDLLSFNRILEINRVATEVRYSTGSVSNIYISITLPFVYLLPMLGAYNTSIKINIKSIILSAISLIPTLAILVLLNTKAVFIGSFVFYLTTFIVGYYYNHKEYIPITKKLVGFSIVIILGFVLIMLVAFGLRAGFSSTFFTSIKERFVLYAFAGVPALDKWLDTVYINNFNLIGKYTFLGIYSLLGIASKNAGVYQDFIVAGILNTNVYTVFRGLIEDFSVVGCMLIFVLVGILARLFEVLIKKNKLYAVGLYMTLFAFFIYGIIISIFTYNSYILAIVMFTIIIYFWPRGEYNENVSAI